MMTARDWRMLAIAALLTGLACAALMVWVDMPLAQYMARHRETQWVRVFDTITDIANSGIWYVLALLGVAYARWRARRDGGAEARALYARRFHAGLFVIASMIASGVLVNALKSAIGRPRPKMSLYEGIHDFAPFQRWPWDGSFPSGHSQSIWAAMIAIAFVFPRWRIPLLIFAAFISSTRIIVSAHYASDVVAGAFVAFAVAVPVWRWFGKRGPVALGGLTATRST